MLQHDDYHKRDIDWKKLDAKTNHEWVLSISKADKTTCLWW